MTNAERRAIVMMTHFCWGCGLWKEIFKDTCLCETCTERIALQIASRQAHAIPYDVDGSPLALAA